MNPIQEYFYRVDEPARSALLFIREKILNSDELITETFSFGLPFLKYKNFQIDLNELIAVKLEYRGRASKFMILIYKDYSEKVFRIDILHAACIKELTHDLKATGLTVLDSINSEPINMNANYTFRLRNKKISKKA